MKSVIIHGTKELAVFIKSLLKAKVNFTAYPKPNDVNVIAYIVEFE